MHCQPIPVISGSTLYFRKHDRLRSSTYMYNRHARCDSCSGFSLIELLVVVAIAAIILGIASPNYSNFIDRENVGALVEEYSLTISAVRSDAIQSGTPVFLCASSDNETCGGHWNEGWLAYRDEDRDTNLGVDDAVVLKRNFGANVTIVSVTSPAGNDVDRFSFNYRGAPDVAVAIQILRGDQSKSMTVTPFGRLRLNE